MQSSRDAFASAHSQEQVLSLSPGVTRLLLKSLAGWRIPPVSVEQGGRFCWDGENLGAVVTVRESHGKIAIECRASSPVVSRFLAHEFRNKHCRASLSGGMELYAQLAYAQIYHDDDTLTFESYYWTLSPAAISPSLWYSTMAITAPDGPRYANAVVRLQIAHSDSDAQPFRPRYRELLLLKGMYHYYLVFGENRSDEAVVIIDTLQSGAPQRSVLHREFTAIQFVLGQRLHLGTLGGVDDDGTVIAYAGGPYGLLRDGPQHSPISPIGNDLELQAGRAAGKFAAALFGDIVRVDRECPDYKLAAAMTWYLTSIGDLLEGSALKLHIGLEGLAYHLFPHEAARMDSAETDLPKNVSTGRKRKKLYLSNRHVDWLAWCTEQESRIRAMTRADIPQDALLTVIRRADQPGTSQKVRAMLDLYGIPRTPDIERVLDARNDLVHQAQLPEESDVDRFVQHQSIPRELIVALLSKAVGYTGPILGENQCCGAAWPLPHGSSGLSVAGVTVSQEQWTLLTSIPTRGTAAR